MKFLIGLSMLLVSCSSIEKKVDECPNCVEQTQQDPFGLLTVRAPDVAAYEVTGFKPRKIFVEC